MAHQYLLEVNNLKKKFPLRSGVLRRISQYVNAVNDVSFFLRSNETLGLVGESGSGKSTLGKIIMGLLKPTEGYVVFEGQNISSLSPGQFKKIREKIQMIFQDPIDSLNSRFSVEQIIKEPLEINRKNTAQENSSKTDELMEIVGLNKSWKYRYPHEFSGGQRQRIGIARALALSPKLIIADEPVSALDVSIQAQILNLMNELQQQLGLSYIFITHDIHVVRYISQRIAVMYLGKIIEIGKSINLLEKASHPYTKALLSSVPKPDPQKRQLFKAIEGEIPSSIILPAGCLFNPRCEYADERCRKELPELRLVNKAEEHWTACHYFDTI